VSALPIDPFIPEILQATRTRRAVVVTAAPGAGKTTRVPPALAADGPVVVLQPRRVAARSLAARVAAEQGWTIGHEVGWHVRFERQFNKQTRVLFATEGILTARLLQDPLLGDFQTIVLDEFHERSVHADLGIALAKQAWLARDDLRLVVMSATLDARAVSTYLDGCPVIDVPGTLHALDVRYAPAMSLADVAASATRESAGQVLCFLPGAGEITQASRELEDRRKWGPLAPDTEVVELHGSLDADAQSAAIAPASRRRIILATNVAETSLTVPGVAFVVDTGLHKVARYDAERGIDSLDTERISLDAADQRAGRAARLGPGVVVRLWDRADRLRPHREPEIQRIDLAATILDVLAWGGDPQTFDWFDPPRVERITAAFDLLARLGATAGRRLTDLGRQMQRLPVSPRLAAILIAAHGARDAAMACALLAERRYQPTPGSQPTTTSDLLSIVERERRLPTHVQKTARLLQSLIKGADTERLDEAAFRRALLAGYPDRVAKRREPGSPRVLLASGHGAVIGPESGVRDGDFLVALDVTAGRSGQISEARIRIASVVERAWLVPTHTGTEHMLDPAAGTVRAVTRDYLDAMVLAERAATPQAEEVERLLSEAYLSRPRTEADEQLLRRARFAGIEFDLPTIVGRAVHGIRSLADIDLGRGFSGDEQRRIESLAPLTMRVPSGRDVRLQYQSDGSVSAGVKLQELFGLADTPRVGPARAPVLLELLAPNGRPVQLTRDLRSFWERTYPEVRKELRARYPKHPWPEDPWTATPTARTTKAGSKRK
jgi:ATP-dependent helicase HrpB